MRVYLRKPPADVRHGWAMTGRILTTLASEAWGRDSRLAIAYIPSRMEVNDRDWELTRLRYGLDEAELRPRRGADALEPRSRGASAFPSSTSRRRCAHATGLVTWPYYDFDSHWNAIGHAVAAREVEAFLRRQGWACAR